MVRLVQWLNIGKRLPEEVEVTEDAVDASADVRNGELVVIGAKIRSNAVHNIAE